MNDELKGKTALVTGSSRGIGRAAAVALAQAGADVAVNYLANEVEAKKTCADIEQTGRRSVAVRADVSVRDHVSRLINEVRESLGDVSILVNNAGIGPRKPFSDITEEDWDQVLRINLKSMFLMTQAVLPAMRARRWGRIINLSSVAAQVGGVIGPHYAASKAGAIGLTHSYASLLAKEGITVNAIAPALVATDMVADLPKSHHDVIPVGRLGTVEEVAAVVAMLATNGYITGQTVNVNGGWQMS